MNPSMTPSKRLHTLLRWSEKYTKTDMVYLTGGTFWLSLGQFFSSISSFFLSIAFGNFLPPVVYGTYKYAITLAGILSTFSLSGLEFAIVQAVSRGYEGVLSRGFWINIVWSSPLVVGAFGGALYYHTVGNDTIAIALLIIGLTTPLFNSANLYAPFLSGRKDFKTRTFYYLFRNLIPTAALLTTLYFTTSAVWIIATYFISNTAVSLVLYYLTVRIHHPNNNYDAATLSYGKHLSIINIVETVADNLDKVLIFHYLGAAQLAVYSFAIAMPEQIKGYYGSVTSLILPKYSERPMHEIRAGMKNKMMQFFFISLCIVIVYIIVSPYIFTLFFHPYISAIFYSQVYALALLPVGFTPAGVALTAKRRIRDQYAFSLITSVFQIIITILFIFLWGLMGLIVARIATRTWGGLMYLYFYSRIPLDA